MANWSPSCFKLSQISKKFSNIFIEKNPHIIGTIQFEPVLFKGQLYKHVNYMITFFKKHTLGTKKVKGYQKKVFLSTQQLA